MMSNYGQAMNRDGMTKLRERLLIPMIIADHRSERFPPKACPVPDPGLLDFGDKETLQKVSRRG
jgi:hypothetical protein